MRAQLSGVVAGLLLERPARRQGLAAQVAGLETAGKTLEARLHRAAGTSKDREVLRHIVGIERWGVRRLELAANGLAFGEAVTDSHQLYKPASDDWAVLVNDFVETRKGTLELVHTLTEAQGTVRVAHNSFGPLSVRAWLRYLKQHAGFEGRKIRPR